MTALFTITIIFAVIIGLCAIHVKHRQRLWDNLKVGDKVVCGSVGGNCYVDRVIGKTDDWIHLRKYGRVKREYFMFPTGEESWYAYNDWMDAHML